MSDKTKALDAALQAIKKAYGDGAVQRLGQQSTMNVEAVPTGSLSLDLALGIGGVPKGRITEIYGPESSGKTTVALHIVAEVQKTGGKAAYIDVENALDPKYAKNLGVDVDNLLVSQPDTGEQALEIMEMLVRSSAIDVIVLDSVAALVPKAEIEGEMGDSHMGLQARLMGQAMRKLTNVISKSNTVAIFINQLRSNMSPYGAAETTTGGRALKFFASVRIDVRKKEVLKQGDQMIGSRTHAKIVKNKVAPPFKVAEFDIMYGEGISKEGNIVDVATKMGIIGKAGAWFSYGEDKIGQGREAVKKLFKDKPEFMAEIEKQVREKLNKKDADYADEMTADDIANKESSDEQTVEAVG